MPNNNGARVGHTILDKLASGREYRNISLRDITASQTENEYIVDGYATTFDNSYVLYDSGDYRIEERIDAHAFDSCDMTDVIVQYDHNGHVYARTSNGTLELAVDGHGLLCRIHLGGTAIGRQLYEEIKGGYTSKMSFGFVVGSDSRTVQEDYETNKTTVIRTITGIKKLYDVSAVSLPANDATEISARGYCDGLIAELTEEHRKAQQNKNAVNTLKLLLEVN